MHFEPKCLRKSEKPAWAGERKLTVMKKGLNKFLSAFLAIAILLTTIPITMTARAAAGSNTTLVDGSTHHQWHDNLEKSTKEIGRIWTDKTVWNADVVYPFEHHMPNQLGVERGDSDFLVELSALSSAATVTGKVSATLPLDIVMVLDVSGSMDNSISTGVYTRTRTAGTRVSYSTLYNDDFPCFKIGDEYVELKVERTGFISARYTVYYTAPGATAPTYLANNAPNADIQLPYDLYEEETITQMQALKNAVNAFIDQTKTANDAITNQANQHRISLVEFSYEEDTQSLIGLTYVNSDTNVNTLKRHVNGLSAYGATRADAGMNEAKNILTNTAREGAQKVVIFFTDGTPTTSNNFSATVANGAITHAKTLKDADTIIYTVGVYEEADPGDLTANFNQYMHGMSSNYPDATAYTNLGTREADSAYYLSANNAVALNGVFSEIFEDVTSLKAVTPTQTQEGNEDTSGYITFVDMLGQYMKVDDFKAISFAERNFTNPTVTAKDGNPNVFVYTFQGENSGNPMYPTTGNLNQIIIEVETFSSLAQGDIVTVKIPAALIPIHYYSVAIDENGNITMQEDTTMPIRLWYGVSVKDGVEKMLENPDAQMQSYIASNRDTNGNVLFYAGLYEEGNVTSYSTFEPNQKNNFYFYQTDEYLFTDEACQQPATVVDFNLDYYYQRDYYHPVANPSYALEAEKLVNTTKIPGSSYLILAGYAKADENGYLYVPKGTPRTTSITDYRVNKADVATNLTDTSEYAIYPTWLNVMNSPTTVQNELGNNGVLKMAIPGTLAVTKLVTADEGLTAPGKAFTFEIALNAPNGVTLNGFYDAQIFAADGSPVSPVFAFQSAGENTVALQAGQTVSIYGLPQGTTYSVSEGALPSGFTQVGQTTVTGQIVSGAVSQVTITNHYSASEITLTGAQLGLTGTKVLDGRDFKAGDKFEFRIAPTVYSPDAPLPVKNNISVETVTVEPTSGNSADFDIGTFTFTKPGEYHYEIREIIPDAANKVLGVSYDSAIYRIGITVADNAEGQLILTSLVVEKSDSTSTGWAEIYRATTLPTANSKFINFVNTYATDAENIVLRGMKVLENKNLTDYAIGKFQFRIQAAGSRPIGNDGAFASDVHQPVPTNPIVSAATTGDIVFPDLVFNGNADVVGKEFKYIVTEVQPTDTGLYDGAPLAGAVKDGNGNWVYEGITYDKSEKEILIQVTSQHEVINTVDTEVIVPVVTGNQFTFTNTYRTNVVTFSPEGEKVLDGRDFADGDIFQFEIEALGDAPKPLNGASEPVSSVTIEPTQGNRTGFSFGTITFDQDDMRNGQTGADGTSKVKTFTYVLREKVLSADGITYDSAEKTLTLELKDNHGELVLVSAKVDGNPITDGKITWTNTYRASVTYAGIDVVKVLEGKAISQGEFTFRITAAEGTPDLDADNREFTVPINAYYNATSNTSTVNMMKLQGIVFDQDDAGKTFCYTVEEEIPAETGKTVYDKSQYRLELMPYDNGDGTMGVKTVITQIKNAQGQTVTHGQNTEFDSKNATVPTITFTNAYQVDDAILEGATNLMVTKNFMGRAWKDTDVFQFTLTLKSTAPAGAVVLPAETTISIDKNTQNHSKAFGDIRFTQEGTYIFNVQEIVPTGGKKDGVTYDALISEIVVEVVNNGEGALVATVKSADTLTFINVYEIGTGCSVSIRGDKVLTGKDLVDGAFTFELYESDETFAVTGEPTTKTNEDGKFAFDLTYEATDAGKTFYYVLREQNGGETIDGIFYDATEYHITVNVKDDGVGGSMAIVTIVKGTDEVQTIQFENEYEVRDGDSIEIEGSKDLTGRDMVDGEFTFELYDANEDFETSGTPKTDTNASGAFQFVLDYQASDAGQTFYYVLKEKNAGQSVNGVTFDDTEYHITVVVTDDGNGGIHVTKLVKKGEETVTTISFQNDYKALDAKVTLSGQKELVGRDLIENEFRFQLYKTDNTFAFNANEPLQTVKNGANGQFVFAEYTFDAVGSYYFVIVEDTSVAMENVTFDQSEYHITIEVTDDGNGNLVAGQPVIVKKGSAEAVEKVLFKNIYTTVSGQEPPPKTADVANLNLWLSMLYVSGFGLTATTLLTKKKKSEDEQ